MINVFAHSIAASYVDPSVMTYVIQVAAGVVIAVGAGLGVYFRKAKKRAKEALHIEDNKEVESDDIELS